MRNKIFTKIIITTLLVAFLTLNVGRVTRVSAVGTTIAAASAAALCAVGIVYCSYMTLTNASVRIPDTVDNIEDWLIDMGNQVVQYPSGRAAYEELYPEIIGIGDEPLHDLLDRAWDWTADKLKAWANDFSSTDVISNIAQYEFEYDGPRNGYSYQFTAYPDTVNTGGSNYISLSTLAQYVDIRYGEYGTRVYNTSGYIEYFVNTYQNLRNFKTLDGTYKAQGYDGISWRDIANVPQYVARLYQPTGEFFKFLNLWNNTSFTYGDNAISLPLNVLAPPLLDYAIYDEYTGEYSELVDPIVVSRPQWPVFPPPDDDNKPVIPYVKLPFDPNWIDPVTNISGGGKWGLNLSSLLDKLEDLAGLMMEIGTIGELINQFKDLISGQTGDVYYIYYDDSENNESYYQYYTITNYNGDVYQYDIDVSQADEHLPIDLNTIQIYSNNRYLEQIKQSVLAGSSMLRDLAVFWYDVDSEVTFILFGCCILVLIGAFTGKLGHS